MKTALCLSGRWNEHCNQKWIDRTQRIIPHDRMFTGTWKGQDFDVDYYFDEPENEYHPIFDISPYPNGVSKLYRTMFDSIIERGLEHQLTKSAYASANWHKQILIHNEMMKSIPEEYDMIIRTRFDVVVSEVIPWEDFLDESYEGVFPIGFNCVDYRTIYGYNELVDMRKEQKQYINDGLIMHPREIWDTDLVDSLYKDKGLRAAEEGWYQILSEPLGMFHKSYHGGCYPSDKWKYVKDVDEGLHN